MTQQAYIRKVSGPLVLAISDKDWQVAPGEMVNIPAGISNLGTEVLDVELSAPGIPDDWVVLDKKSPIRLLPKENQELVLTIAPPPYPQCRPGEYPATIQAVVAGRPEINVKVSDTLVIAGYQSEGPLAVLMVSTQYSVTPGEDLVIPMTIINRGTGMDTFQLNVTGLSSDWITIRTPSIKIEDNESKDIQFVIKVPRSSDTDAGRNKFKVQVSYGSNKKVEIDCILTVSFFSKFTASIPTTAVPSGKAWQLKIKNDGNARDGFIVNFENPNRDLIFEKGVNVSSGSSRRFEFVEISGDDTFNVDFGKTASIPFRTRSRSVKLIGRSAVSPFVVKVQSGTTKQQKSLDGEVLIRPLIPMWILLTFLFLMVSAMLTPFIINIGIQYSDNDGDGLVYRDEIEFGSDPENPDYDNDGLNDRVEYDQKNKNSADYGCLNPKNHDSDGDTIWDKLDLDPCNSSNPKLTAQAPTLTPLPTATFTPASTPTLTLTSAPTQVKVVEIYKVFPQQPLSPMVLKRGGVVEIDITIRTTSGLDIMEIYINRVNVDNESKFKLLNCLISPFEVNKRCFDTPTEAGFYRYDLNIVLRNNVIFQTVRSERITVEP